MLKNLKIRTKITLPIVLTAVVVFLAASAHSYFFTIEVLEREAVRHLETSAQLMKIHVSDTVNEQKEEIEITATHSELSLEELHRILNISADFYEIFVLDSNGIIINSTQESNIGLDRSNDDYFVNALDKTYIKPAYFSERTQKNSIAVATPHAEGVLVGMVELELFDSIVDDRTGFGETGEGLLAYRGKNGEPVFFTDRRFSDEENIGTYTSDVVLPIEQALSKNEDIFFELDYRSVPVLAITKYIEEIDIGLVFKIDQAEALAPGKDLLIFSVIRLLVVLLVFFIITFFIARIISKPIEKLYKGTESIARGDLEYKVGIESKDEIGELSRSFDNVTESLKKSKTNIEQQVVERTAQLEKTNRFMTGRELKMLELKKEIKELKKQAGNK